MGRIFVHAPLLSLWYAPSVTHGGSVSGRAAGGHVCHVTTCSLQLVKVENCSNEVMLLQHLVFSNISTYKNLCFNNV